MLKQKNSPKNLLSKKIWIKRKLWSPRVFGSKIVWLKLLRYYKIILNSQGTFGKLAVGYLNRYLDFMNWLRRAFQIKTTTKFWTHVQTGSILPTKYPSMDKNKFGQVLLLSTRAVHDPYFTNDPIFRSCALKRTSNRILGFADILKFVCKRCFP